MSREDARINFTTPESVKDDLIAVAKKHNRNLSQELNVIIAEYLDRESRAHPCCADGEIPAAMVEMMRAIAREEVKNAGTSVSMVNNGRDAKQDVKIGK